MNHLFPQNLTSIFYKEIWFLESKNAEVSLFVS